MDKYNANEALNVQLGQAGYDIIGSGETVNQTSNPGVTWVAITVLTGSTDDGKNSTGSITATSVDTDVWDSLSTVAVPTGTTIYGRWSVVTTASSDIAIAYRG
jgi:hypothetical protein